MPFEYFSALSRDPLLLRLCHGLGMVVLLLVSACQLSAAQETNAAPAEKPASQPVPVEAAPAQAESAHVAPVQATNGVAIAKPDAPPEMVKESSTPTPPSPARASTRSSPTSKSGTASTDLSYDSFKLIADRNIFNASRSPRSSRAPSTNPPPRAKRVESFALVGTMSYAKGDFAFFDGTSPQYRKALKAGDAIGAYKVQEVTPNQVKLAGEKKEWELKVGQQLRREDEGEWQLTMRTLGSSESGGNGGPSISGSSSSSSSSSGSSESGDVSDVLKRLREKRREQESNQ